jgi:hypothetical protein
MIPSPNHESRAGAAVRLIVVHTAEGARTVGALGNFFANPAVQASSHVGIDDNHIEQYVPYDQAAWTVLSANRISENAELCGFAAWDAAEWARHPHMLELTAQWIADRCRARGIPIVKLSPADVAAGRAGVIGHIDWTLGMHDGTHTDPGPAFPWAAVIDRARAIAGEVTEEDDMTPEQDARLRRIETELLGPKPGGWDTRVGPRTVVAMLGDLVNSLLAEEPSLVAGSTAKFSAVRAIRFTDANAYNALQGITKLLASHAGIDEAKLAEALAPAVVAHLRDHVGKLTADDLQAIAAAVRDEEDRRAGEHAAEPAHGGAG